MLSDVVIANEGPASSGIAEESFAIPLADVNSHLAQRCEVALRGLS
jgi:hypothetical protein